VVRAAVCIIDETGTAIEQITVKHSAAGLGKLATLLHHHGVAGVAIERGDGPAVQALLDASLTVFVIASRQVTALRSRYGTAGNTNDRFDAYLLADVTHERNGTVISADSSTRTSSRGQSSADAWALERPSACSTRFDRGFEALIGTRHSAGEG
jgi:hypothetical protein